MVFIVFFEWNTWVWFSVGDSCGDNVITSTNRFKQQNAQQIVKMSKCSEVYILRINRLSEGLHSCLSVFSVSMFPPANYNPFSKQQSHVFISCLCIGWSCCNLSTCQVRGFGSKEQAVKTNLITLRNLSETWWIWRGLLVCL